MIFRILKMFAEDEEGEEGDSYGTTSMDLAELEEMEEALDEDELEEEEKVLLLSNLGSIPPTLWRKCVSRHSLTQRSRSVSPTKLRPTSTLRPTR
jgi:hypothetical protein